MRNNTINPTSFKLAQALLYALLIAGTLAVAGCATHAEIQMPMVEKTTGQQWVQKKVTHRILYSQPEPGLFTGGDQLPLAPVEESQMSVGAVTTLQQLPTYLERNLPNGVVMGTATDHDFMLQIELIAHDKKGPAYADYEFTKSLGTNLLTLGFAPSEYDIIADFDVTYRLFDNAQNELFTRSYQVEESVDHQRGDFESVNSGNDFVTLLFEKHINLTLNKFLKEVPRPASAGL